MASRPTRPRGDRGGLSPDQDFGLSRRGFIKSGTAAAGSLAAGSALASGAPAHLPPNVPPWSRYLGASVDAAPYGMPSPHEQKWPSFRGSYAAHHQQTACCQISGRSRSPSC